LGLRHSEECELLLVRAREFAEKNNFLGVEHVFLALIDRERELIKEMLSPTGVSIDYILEEMNNYCWSTSEKPIWNEFITTPRMKNLPKIAEKEALNARSMKIEPIHYLLAILKERRGVVSISLINSGLSIDELYENFSEGYSSQEIPVNQKVDKNQSEGKIEMPLSSKKGLGIPGAGSGKESVKKARKSILSQIGRDLTDLARPWYEIDEETISNLTKGEWFKIEDIIIDSYKGRIAEKHLHIIEVLKQKLKEDKIKVLAKDKLIKILKQDFSKEEIAEIIKLIPEGAKIKFDDEKLKPIKSKDAKRFSKEELTEKLKKSYSEEEEIQAIQNAALKRNLDPVIGRKNETMSLIQVLCRRGKSNPVIIGEPGVGKTALVMALAQRIADKRVPEHLQDKKLIELGMSSLVAGTKHRGEFEERFDQLLKELQQDSNLLVFIDELHLIIGAGDSKGGMDAANILKPALARGDISLIGATTIDEYRKYIEKDPALERRFQTVQVNEPSEEDTVEILKTLRPKFEKHHKVKISDDAIMQAVKLSVRYLTERFLPDKAIDLIDEACSSVKVQQYASLSLMPGRYKYDLSTGQVEDITEDISSSTNIIISGKEIAQVISLWTDIPVVKLTTEESVRLSEMENILKDKVKGQDGAVHKVSQVVKMARLGLANPGRPRGVFLFLGSTGVGKTELAKALAAFLFGSEEDLIRLDMSEYKEKHSISKLIGSPAGYVGYEDEGRFTRMVRTKPYSVVLLDEVEKAHPEVFDIFLQVFDEGRLTDQRGRTINFCNTIIIMTSNLAVDYDEILKHVEEEKEMAGEGWAIDEDMVEREKICDKLQEYFRPEFLNRIDEIVVFNPLQKEVLRAIAGLNIDSFLKRLREEKAIEMQVEDDVIELILKYGYNPRYGARPLKRAVQRFLINSFAQRMLEVEFKPGDKVYATLQGEKVIFRKEGETPMEDERNDLDDDGGDEDFLNRTCGPER